MKHLFKRHFQAIVNRGLITSETTLDDFYDKLNEEVNELQLANTNEEVHQEAIDVVMVCINMLQYLGVNFEKELIKNIETQEKRANIKSTSC